MVSLTQWDQELRRLREVGKTQAVDVHALAKVNPSLGRAFDEQTRRFAQLVSTTQAIIGHLRQAPDWSEEELGETRSERRTRFAYTLDAANVDSEGKVTFNHGAGYEVTRWQEVARVPTGTRPGPGGSWGSWRVVESTASKTTFQVDTDFADNGGKVRLVGYRPANIPVGFDGSDEGLTSFSDDAPFFDDAPTTAVTTQGNGFLELHQWSGGRYFRTATQPAAGVIEGDIWLRRTDHVPFVSTGSSFLSFDKRAVPWNWTTAEELA